MNGLTVHNLFVQRLMEKTKYKVSNCTFPLKFASKIYCCDLTPQEAEDDQQQLKIFINKLNNDYNPRKQTKIKEKDYALMSAKKLFFMREEIISAFKKGIFLYIDRFQVEKETDEETNEKRDEESTLENEKIDTTDIPELESEESAAQRKNIKGKGLKMQTKCTKPNA